MWCRLWPGQPRTGHAKNLSQNNESYNRQLQHVQWKIYDNRKQQGQELVDSTKEYFTDSSLTTEHGGAPLCQKTM